ncbi:MAG: hypothetical protein AAF235_08035 [Planctomycetota bacterium]
MIWAGVVLAMLVAACSPEAKPAADSGSAGANSGRQDLRLVVLSPAIGVIARDIGLEDAIVGRHDFDFVLADSVPKVGDQTAIDYEALLATRPTHVITQWGSRDLPPRLVDLADQRGFKLIDYELLTLDHIAEVADDLFLDFVQPPGRAGFQPGTSDDITPRFIDPAEAFGRALPSERMARAWRQRGDGFADLGRVLLLGSVDPPAVLGPGSFHHQVLVRIGGTPAVESGSPWMELDAEDVLRLAPDAVVLVAPRSMGANSPAAGAAMSSDDGAERLEARFGIIARLGVPASSSGRLAVIDDPLSLLPSTSMIRFADDLAAVLDGWR